jgi:hypothetical protein
MIRTVRMATAPTSRTATIRRELQVPHDRPVEMSQDPDDQDPGDQDHDEELIEVEVEGQTGIRPGSRRGQTGIAVEQPGDVRISPGTWSRAAARSRPPWHGPPGHPSRFRSGATGTAGQVLISTARGMPGRHCTGPPA